MTVQGAYYVEKTENNIPGHSPNSQTLASHVMRLFAEPAALHKSSGVDLVGSW